MATGAILGIAREAGETAPLLFTAFGYNLMNANPFKGPQESLPLFIYRFIREPLESSIQRGFAGALVLMLLIGLVVLVLTMAQYYSKKSEPPDVAPPPPDSDEAAARVLGESLRRAMASPALYLRQRTGTPSSCRYTARPSAAQSGSWPRTTGR